MNPVQHILIWSVRLYRWTLSPAKTFLYGPLAQCRFTPSCSQYAMDAIANHGAIAGIGLAVQRICRCHPWGECGDDPAPDRPRKFAVPASGGSLSAITAPQTNSPSARAKTGAAPGNGYAPLAAGAELNGSR